MQRVGFPFQVGLYAALCLSTFVFFSEPSAAQSTNATPVTDSRGDRDFASTGRLTILVQDTAGEPFFQGATITLLTSDIATRLSTVSDEKGHAQFTALPVGQYVVEITAPGYRTVQSQIIIATTREAQNITAAMVPASGEGKVKVGAVSVSPKAVKESEKALHALQLNRLEEAQQHLTRALTFDPVFADGNYLMGLLLLRQKESAKAAAYLQKSVQLSPDHPAALLALGEAQYLDHDYAHAAESFEKFLREQPNSPQAPVAQKYVSALRKVMQAKAAAGTEALSATSNASATSSNASSSGDATADPDLPPLPDITPATETNWVPPDVDAEKLALDPGADCHLDDVLQGASKRVQELIRNVDRFTATEDIEHISLSSMGLETSRQTRQFNYLVEIHNVGHDDLDVQEYRNGSVSTEEFPGHIATVGLPTLALVFHPSLQERYEFRCEGVSSWDGKSAWVVHFQQRTDRASGMLTYHVGRRFISVGLKGRAWIDAKTSQILAMESDITHPISEIRLTRDHQLIQYGPVSFRKKSTELWLPISADWYCSISGKRFHRRHTFSHFLLFSVEHNETISAPKEPVDPPNPQR